MDELMAVEVEAFPSSNNIYMTFNHTNVESNPDENFEIEVERSEVALAGMLRKVKATSDGVNPVPSFVALARQILQTNVGSFYAPKPMVGNLIDLYCDSPRKIGMDFPGQNNGADNKNQIVFKVTEKTSFKNDTWVNGKLIEGGTKITLIHKGAF